MCGHRRRARPILDACAGAGQSVIFNLAGQVSHIDSMTDPLTDLEINARSQLSILEACRYENPSVKIVYAGTRQQYGKPRYLPLDEDHPQAPTDVNGVNKLAGEWYHIVYHTAYGLRTTSLRLTNTYGPRQLITQPPGLYRLVYPPGSRGQTIQLYGDGRQLRDLTYVDDVIEAFLLAGSSDAANGRATTLAARPPSASTSWPARLSSWRDRATCASCPGPRIAKRSTLATSTQLWADRGGVGLAADDGTARWLGAHVKLL